MSLVRVIVGLLFVCVVLCTAAEGWCAVHNDLNLDRQMGERAKQYCESLRQRAQQVAPSLQTKIESQTQQTVVIGLEKWKNGRINIQIALPGYVETYRVTRFFSRHVPFPGSPVGSFATGNSLFNAALTITSVLSILKSFAISVFDSTVVHSFVGLIRQGNEGISSFIQIVRTVVLRR